MLYDPRHDLDSIGKVLDAAADALVEGKWCRFPFTSLVTGEAMCVLLAIGAVSQGHERLAANNRLEKFLQFNPVLWNDHVCQNQAEAVAALRCAARM